MAAEAQGVRARAELGPVDIDPADVWSVEGVCLHSDARNMAREVNKTLIEIVRDCGKKTEDEAATFVKELRTASRYVEDVWS